ncbi:PHB depolymerase family esterase [Kineosporia sp. NBRC 101731]|uniref:prolyl oligopeptidase family serine peptidase n=1 Tax=Kineosporia sp. NBRC 101731 TaxID=3032199 RepID=UPI0024A556D5|nr:PHB depolymerase family esterase [Kineosporia sp. NBRC 101731]GLY30984.1 hypothetical protein Kisp02_43490 [Kineosporia sp. NBRC 101731]
MSLPISRRGVLTAGLGATTAVLVPSLPAHASTGSSSGIGFVLGAETLDGGEQITSITLDTARLGPIAPESLSRETFTVHARATSPITPEAGALYDLDRPVTAARLDRRGNIVLELEHGEGQPGAGTLGYIASRGRNVRLDLTYTLTQRAPLARRHGKPLLINRFAQGELVNPEVDAFGYHESAAGLKYRLYSSPRRGRRPLVVWLHGGGEGASLPDGYYDNETTLRANRGALGFATREAQQIFGGAHVVAPQSTSYWMHDGPRFAPLVREVVQEVCARRDVDPDRIYVAGCSNGGYMSLKMTTVYPRLFAASVPVCGVVAGTPPLIPDADLRAITTPTWLIASLDDTTVDPVANTIHAHDLVPHSRATLYEHVERDGYRFPGHWSWIYLARNDPSIDGTHVWQWMAGRRR